VHNTEKNEYIKPNVITNAKQYSIVEMR